MIAHHIVSAERIRSELATIEQVVMRVQRAVDAVGGNLEDSDLYWDAIALNLHDFYTGLERVLSHIAAQVDGHLPEGGEWHRELLRQMAIPLPRIRPAVFSEATIQRLDEYLRFRHVVRHVYAFEFDPQRIRPLAEALAGDFAQVKGELLIFIDYLKGLADADQIRD